MRPSKAFNRRSCSIQITRNRTWGSRLRFRATGSHALAEIALDNVEASLSLLASARPIEAGIVRAELLTARGNAEAAVAELGRLLEQAPPGFAGWTLPAEFLLRQLSGAKGLQLSLRAWPTAPDKTLSVSQPFSRRAQDLDSAQRYLGPV